MEQRDELPNIFTLEDKNEDQNFCIRMRSRRNVIIVIIICCIPTKTAAAIVRRGINGLRIML
jgi:hypothetical protein